MIKFLRSASILAASFAALSAVPGHATVLVSETNTPRPVTNYSFNFVATSASTSVSFAGFQLPSYSHVRAITLVRLGQMTNLLGQSWTYTPAPAGALAGQGPAGLFGTNDLTFGGVVVNAYDVFTQNFASTSGQGYTLSFRYDNPNGASGFRAETSARLQGAVPEPATWLMLIAGFGLMGAALRRRQKVTVRYA